MNFTTNNHNNDDDHRHQPYLESSLFVTEVTGFETDGSRVFNTEHDTGYSTTPSSTTSRFKPTDKRLDQLSFFINGMINNFTYVVFLSAAEDIVGESLPKAAVLMVDILPAFLVKLLLPYYMHRIPYAWRIIMVVASAMFSLYAVALSKSLTAQLAGIVVASAGSGLGEVTFLAMSSFYSYDVISPWSSGTGGAGVAGALAYLALSTWLGLSPSTSLLVCSLAPLLMLISFFRFMTHPYRDIEKSRLHVTQPGFSPLSDSETCLPTEYSPTFTSNLVQNPDQRARSSVERPENLPLRDRLKLVTNLIPRYMLPLFVVFWAEYTINQGVAPVLLFPLDSTPFKALREHYVYCQFLYQLGVFFSRSSAAYLPINRLYLLGIGQVITLLFLLFQALLYFHSTIYLTFGAMFWEGLFGGAVYANAFRRLRIELPGQQTEFAMGAASVADSMGIAVASITAYVLEPILCQYQVSHGVGLCQVVAGA